MLKFNADWHNVGLNFGEAYFVRQWAFNTMISVKFIYIKCRSVLRFQLAKRVIVCVKKKSLLRAFNR